MFHIALENRGSILKAPFLAFSIFFIACQDDSVSAAGSAEKETGKAPLTTVKDQGLGGKCEGFDILRTPLRMGVEAMPCAQSCPTSHEPVCTDEGLTYPNACYAELAKAVIVSTGDCQ